jgi:cytochrome P450
MSNLPPGPRNPLKIFEIIQQRRKNVLELTKNLFKEYGDFLYFKVGKSKIAVVNDPEVAQIILQTQAKSFSKGIGYNRFKFLLGNGLLTSEGKQWRRQRLLCAPAFTKAAIEKNFPEIIQMINEVKNDWREQCMKKGAIEVDLAQEMNVLALSLISQVMFGSNQKKEAAQIKQYLTSALSFLDISGKIWLRLLFTNIVIGGKPLLMRWEQKFPSKGTRQFNDAVHGLNKIVQSIIKTREMDHLPHEDLLGRLMSATDEEGKMDHDQLRDEVMTILLAGHETTALALAWTWYTLGQNDEALKKVISEINEVLGPFTDLTFQKLEKLKYTKCVFEESMRLYPPFWRLSRRCLEDVKIGEYTLPRDTDVVISTYTLHRHEKYWVEPEKFQPERMFEEEKKKRHSFSFIPFGAGPRVCIGETFAYTEALAVLASLIQTFKITPLSNAQAEPELSITMKPKNGYKVKIELRHVKDQLNEHG